MNNRALLRKIIRTATYKPELRPVLQPMIREAFGSFLKHLFGKAGQIEKDTDHVPQIIAEKVVREVVDFLDDITLSEKVYDLGEKLAEPILLAAEKRYAQDAAWARKVQVKGHAGEAPLFQFMRQELVKVIHHLIPEVAPVLPHALAAGVDRWWTHT